MELECSFDELLCQSILLFRQNRIYGDGPECEEKASLMLREARCYVNQSKDHLCMAQWGCVIECLSQKFYINNETDEVLEDIDAALISFWKKAESSDFGAFKYYLWIGYYFMFRFRNSQSRFHSRSKRVISDIVTYLTEIFRKFKKQSTSIEPLALFSADVWADTVYWVELVHDTRVCEKQSANLLGQLYDLKRMELQQSGTGQNILLERILEFYCF